MTLSTISVADMHCAACAGRIRAALATLEGVTTTRINPARRQVLVEHAEATDPSRLLQSIEAAGFHPSLTHTPRHDGGQKQLLKRLGVAGLAMMQVMMAAVALYAGAFDGMDGATRRLFEYTSLMFCIPVVCYSAVPFYRNAVRAIGTGITMDVPIALAITLAFAASVSATLRGDGEVYYDSVVMFTFLLLTARYLDDRLRQRFADSASALAALPQFGLQMRGNSRYRIALDQIRAGDRLWVATGEQVPVDGQLQSETATVDESILTGESTPVAKRLDDQVFAGTLNGGAGFAMTATSAFDRSRVSDIARLAESAAAANPPIARLADRVARYFVPGILLLAMLTWISWHLIDPAAAFRASLAVLVVSCPCALSLATPAAVTAAMTRLRQAGIVLTRSDLLEQIPKLTRALVDKTGTLTVHEPHIQTTTLFEAHPPADAERIYLDLAGALQQYANHPIARAFPQPCFTHVEKPRVIAGSGVEGLWKKKRVRIGNAGFCGVAQTNADDPFVYLSIEDTPVARFDLSDRPRADARQAVDALRDLQVPVTMISGDSPERCARLAAELDVGFIARQAPETKLAVTRALQQQGERVLVVGDGINDMPALAAADVSAAVVESNHLVKANADVLLLTRRLSALPSLLTVGSAARKVIRQNIAWALAYNGIAIPLAAMGLVPPWAAALGMAGSSTLVMLNASRLMGVRLPGDREDQELQT